MDNDVRDYWDEQAGTFDNEADHGLRDRLVRAAWQQLLLPLMPPAPASIVDLGCGTGSLSVLLAEAGYDVRGVDISDQMVAAAVAKAQQAGVLSRFQQGDAGTPPYGDGSCDVVLARHVLWALPDPAAAIERWVRLLKPGGVLVLVEGYWSTGAGMTAAECERLVRTQRASVVVRRLDDPSYWGGPISDERYLLVSTA